MKPRRGSRIKIPIANARAIRAAVMTTSVIIRQVPRTRSCMVCDALKANLRMLHNEIIDFLYEI